MNFPLTIAGCLLVVYVQGETPMCKFYGYSADCRYRIDGISMAHITSTLNHCNNPIDVSFHLESTNPMVKWHHTFSNDNEVQLVPGYGVNVRMQVLLQIVQHNKLWVKVDFDVDGRQRAYFINEEVELRHMESCIQLNQAGKIAIGCLVALLIVAGILLVILIIVRRRRRLAEQQEDAIIRQMEVNERANSSQGIPPDYAQNMTSSVVRYHLPSIPEQSEHSSDSGHVSIDPSLEQDGGYVQNGVLQLNGSNSQNGVLQLNGSNSQNGVLVQNVTNGQNGVLVQNGYLEQNNIHNQNVTHDRGFEENV